MSKHIPPHDAMKNLQTRVEADGSSRENAEKTSMIRSFAILPLSLAALSLALAGCDLEPAADDEGASTTAQRHRG